MSKIMESNKSDALNPNAKIFAPQTSKFGCSLPLTLKNLTINKDYRCKATNVTGPKYGEQCQNTKIDDYDYCFLHKGMIDSGKYFLLKNKRPVKCNSETYSSESAISTYSGNYSINHSISDSIISIYSNKSDSASTTTLSE